MNSQKIFFIVICFFISACEQSISLPQLPEDAVILAFGDSLTYGTGASTAHDYPSILSELTALTVINEGIPGELSAEGLQRLPALLDEYQPDLLILTHGGNDLLKGRSKQKAANNIRQMIAAAQQRDISVILLGVPLPKLFSLGSAEFYAEVANEYQIPLEQEVLPKVLRDMNLKSDPIHPNDKGYQMIAAHILNLLRQSGAI